MRPSVCTISGFTSTIFASGIFLEGDVDDRDALADADLRSRQPDTVRGIHALEHIVDQLAQFVVELR